MRHLSAILAGSLVSTITLMALAQPAPSEVWASYKAGRAKKLISSAPRELLLRAQEAERAGRRDEALELYAEAFDLQPFPAVEAEYGLALVRMGKYVLGARHLQAAMKAGEFFTGVHTPEYLGDMLAAATKEIGTLAVETNEPESQVKVDGEVVRDWPFYQDIYVEPGEHRIKSTKAGFWMDEQTVTVEKGERKVVRVAMVTRVQSHIVGMERPLNINTEGYLKGAGEQPTWPNKVIVAGVVGLGLGTGLLVTGLVHTPNAETKDEVRTWEGVSTAGGVVGALGIVAIGIGLVYRPNPTPPTVNITPTPIGKNGAGVMVGGVF